MKTTLLVVVLFVLAVFIRCGKADQVEPGSLVAKWILVKDSTANSIGAAQVTTKNYNGLPGDYFDFRADGKCYTREGDVYDTLTYQVIGSNKIFIEKFGFNSADNPCTIDPFTARSATITSPVLNTPGGSLFRVVNLKR